MKRLLCRSLIGALLLSLIPATAPAVVGEPTYVLDTGTPSDFPLVHEGQAATLYLAEAHERGVDLAVDDLVADIEKVTGVRPGLTADQATLGEVAVLIGTIGTSPLIDELAASGKIEIAEVRDQWEAYLIQVVEAPVAGVEKALVIAGSDRRGTLFGIYDLAEKIGVSPWHFWADVAPDTRDNLHVPADTRITDQPDVRFRGIWVNDNHQHRMWAATHIDEGIQFGPKWCGLIAELLLRLKANYMWVPAPPGDFYGETMIENFHVLDERGIWVGSAHNKQLQRDNSWDWQEWAPANIPGVEPGLDKREYWKYYNFAEYPEFLKKYWAERVEKLAEFDIVWSVGLRGVGDRKMISGDATAEDKARVVEAAIAAQREILREHVDQDIESIPQTMVLYKEVLDLERWGNLKIPEDITVVWTDNNQGWVRQFPTTMNRDRNGGHGIYNHISYIGSSGTYLWLNSTPVSQLWHDMDRGYRAGVRDLWILNSGDIKPGELGVDFFLTMAWDAERWTAENLRDYHVLWAKREFGEKHAEAIADVVLEHFEYAIAQRPEWLRADTAFPDRFSMSAYGDEAQQRVDDYLALLAKARKIRDDLSPPHHASYFQLVLYPIHQIAKTWQQQLAVAKAREAADNQVAGVEEFLQQAQEARAAIREFTRFYNDDLSGGKWKHIIWGVGPDIPSIRQTLPDSAELNLRVEGSSAPNEDLELTFSRHERHARFLDILNGGSKPFSYSIKSDQGWLNFSSTGGNVQTRERIWVDVDWEGLPAGEHQAEVTVAGAGEIVNARVIARNVAIPEEIALSGVFLETSGTVSLEAEHPHATLAGGERMWEKVPHLGLSGGVMKSYPDIDPWQLTAEQALQEAPQLRYQIYFTSSGEFPVTLYLRPNLPHFPADLAVGLDNEPPRIAEDITGKREEYHSQRRRKQRTITIHEPGLHELRIYALGPAVLLDKIVIDTGGMAPSFFGPPESPRTEKVTEQ